MNPSNSQSTCRICMRKNSSMNELFGSDCKIVGRIEFCTGIIIRNNPNLSTSICDKCLSHLSIAHDFKTTCIVSDKIFNKLDLKVEVKRGVCDNVPVKKNLDEFRIEIDSTTMRFVVKKLEPTKNIILNKLEPTKNIILNKLEPTKNIILNNLEPTKNIILNKLEPTKNIILNKLEPTKNIILNKLEPTKNIILNKLEPTKCIILNKLEPTKNIILNNLEPTKNIILNKLEPTKNIILNKLEPTKNIILNKLEPTKNIILNKLEPTKNIILNKLEPTKNIILNKLEPTKNIILNKLEPTKNIFKTLNPGTKEIVNLRSNFCKTIKLQLVSKELFEEATSKATKEIGPRKCVYSRKSVRSRKRVRSRILQYRSLYCMKCDIRFETKQEAIEHYVTFHNNPKHVCEVCGKQFVERTTLLKHRRTHDEPSIFCAHCSYGTCSRYDLIVHLRSHTGEKKYHCHACPHVTSTSSNLQSHIRVKHGGLKRHPCNLCDKSFFDGTSLRQHMNRHENIKRHDLNAARGAAKIKHKNSSKKNKKMFEMRYECSVCHSLFKDRQKWKRHLLTIHGVTVPTAKPGRRKTNIVLPPYA